MGLVGILGDVRTALLADAPELEVLLGKDTPARNSDGAGYRVAFVPTTFSFGPAEKSHNNPRSIATRQQQIQVHCWGKGAAQVDKTLQEIADADAALALVDYVVAKLREKAYGIVAHQPGGLTNEALTNGYGAEAVFAFQVPQPVIEGALPVAPGDTTAETTGETQFPDGHTEAVC